MPERRSAEPAPGVRLPAPRGASQAEVLLACTQGVPAVTQHALMRALHKEGDTGQRSDFCSIMLVSMMRKLLCLLAAKQLAVWAEGRRHESPAGTGGAQPAQPLAPLCPPLMEAKVVAGRRAAAPNNCLPCVT